jgi:heme/copper-type cytochrome/quinol oxidase subunit 2
MALLSTIVLAAEEAKIELFFPAWVFPLISVVVFAALAFVVYSYRDVANRHSHKVDGSASGHAADHH